MAKDRKGVPGEPAGGTRPKAMRRRLFRLEQRLEHVRIIEGKRGRQLARAYERGVSLEARISALQPPDKPAGGGRTESSVGPQAYCMREKHMVSMVEPKRIVMRNGRAALSGICQSCGAHVVTTAGAAATARAASQAGIGETDDRG